MLFLGIGVPNVYIIYYYIVYSFVKEKCTEILKHGVVSLRPLKYNIIVFTKHLNIVLKYMVGTLVYWLKYNIDYRLTE